MQGFDKLQSQNNTVEAVDTSTINIIKPGHTRDPVCCNCACISNDFYEACSNNIKYNTSVTFGQTLVNAPQSSKGKHSLIKGDELQIDSEMVNIAPEELNLIPVYENQYEIDLEFDFENTALNESIEIAEESSKTPVLEEDPHLEPSVALKTYENSSEDTVSNSYLQAPGKPDKLEVEEIMEPRTQSTIVFDPCENTNNTDMQNRIKDLEERIARLENEILKLEEINKKLKSRDVIPLNGSMATEPCCGCSR